MNQKADTKKAPGTRRGRSKILYQITALLIVVLVASGLVTFFLVRASQNRLIEQSIDKLIETEVEGVYSAYNYIANLLVPTYEEKLRGMPTEELIKALINEEVTEAQTFVNEELQKMIEDGLLGLESVFVVFPPSALNPDPLILATNEVDLIYSWDIPDYIEEGMKEGTPYIWMEEGIPEMDREGKYLIVVGDIETSDEAAEEGQTGATVVAIRPMSEDVAEITDFYNDEKSKLNILLGLVIGGSILIVVLISFFVLRYLIAKQITEPIDELSAAAEEVMQGNLDVEIEVRKGEEFEELKRAFKEMVESFRKYIAKSVGEE